MAWLKPETEEIRRALRRYAPYLAEEPVEFLSEGWEFWAFTAGDYVLRFPQPEVELHRCLEWNANLTRCPKWRCCRRSLRRFDASAAYRF